MGSSEIPDHRRPNLKPETAVSPDLFELGFLKDVPLTTGKQTRLESLELALLTGQEVDKKTRRPAERSQLITNLTPEEMATALYPLSRNITRPVVAEPIKESIDIERQLSALGPAFDEALLKVIGRPTNPDDFQDRRRMEKLLKGHPELLKQFDQIQNLLGKADASEAKSLKVKTSIEADVNETLKRLCDRMHLPPAKFEISETGGTRADGTKYRGVYTLGKALFSLPETEFDQPNMIPRQMLSTLAHEFKHHIQATLLMAKVIEDLVGNNPLDAKNIAAIKERWKGMIGNEPTTDFIKGVQECRKGYTLTEEERKQATAYEKSAFQKKLSVSINDDIELLLNMNEIHGKQSASDAFGLLDKLESRLDSPPPSEIRTLLKLHRQIKSGNVGAREWDERSASKALTAWLKVKLPALQKELQANYETNLLEIEASKAGNEVVEASRKP